MNTNDKYKVVEAMLYNYKNNKTKIKMMQLDLEALENDYKGVSSITYEERTGPTNAFSSSVENEVIKRDEDIIRLRHKIRLIEIDIQKIDNILELLDDRDKYLIVEYYMNKNQLKNISKHINLDEGYSSAYKTNLISKIVNIMFIED